MNIIDETTIKITETMKYLIKRQILQFFINQLIIRQRLGYKNLGSWDIHRHFNPFIFFF